MEEQSQIPHLYHPQGMPGPMSLLEGGYAWFRVPFIDWVGIPGPMSLLVCLVPCLFCGWVCLVIWAYPGSGYARYTAGTPPETPER